MELRNFMFSCCLLLLLSPAGVGVSADHPLADPPGPKPAVRARPTQTHPLEPSPLHPLATEPVAEETDPMLPAWMKFNLDAPTLGGRQFWGDVVYFRGYRIQHNVLTDHYRLLDSSDIRRAWGTREECEAELERIKTAQGLAPMSGKVVLLIHGIIRSSKSFAPIAKVLRAEGYEVIGFDYPSTRAPLVDSARYLQSTLESLKGVEQVDLVVHSMGGLLVRTYLQQTAGHHDSRLTRLVMLGVPNHGAKMANLLQNNWLFQAAFGPAGQQLVEDPAGFIAKLPAPDFEFAIIAGVRGTPDGWNPLIPGDDDGTVSVESTRLAGATDYIEIPALHSSMMWNADVMAATTRFLKTGALRDGEKCHPLPATEPLAP